MLEKIARFARTLRGCLRQAKKCIKNNKKKFRLLTLTLLACLASTLDIRLMLNNPLIH